MSKNVDKVKEVIKAHLDAMAQKDACFAERYANPDKNIDECMDYILGEARRRGMTVYMSDQEVFGLAAQPDKLNEFLAIAKELGLRTGKI